MLFLRLVGASVSEPPLVASKSARPATFALGANVAGRIGNRVSPSESAFLGPNAMMMNDLGLQRRGRRAFQASARSLGARINAKRGYGSAKAAVLISALSN